MHGIEEASSQGWASTFVTLDIQGAFNAVLYNRLLWRMKEQGWPDSILRWTSSFLHNRWVQVWYSGEVTSAKELVCGVPQGSPISPLLFLLCMAEPMQCANIRARFSYADDIDVLGIGRTIKESFTMAQQEVDSLFQWAHENAVSFDIDKSELIQLPARRQDEICSLTVNGVTIEPSEHICWLGIYLDSQHSNIMSPRSVDKH